MNSWERKADQCWDMFPVLDFEWSTFSMHLILVFSKIASYFLLRKRDLWTKSLNYVHNAHVKRTLTESAVLLDQMALCKSPPTNTKEWLNKTSPSLVLLKYLNVSMTGAFYFSFTSLIVHFNNDYPTPHDLCPPYLWVMQFFSSSDYSHHDRLAATSMKLQLGRVFVVIT